MVYHVDIFTEGRHRMVTMVRHSITIPKKASTLLHRRAKATNSTLSKAIVDIILENDEMLDDLEDLRLSKIVD